MALAFVAVLDARTRRIPNAITVPGLAYGLGMAALTGRPSLPEAALGVLVVGGVLVLVALVSRGGLGGGDVKLGALLGAALGWQNGLVAVALSQVAAAALVLGLLIWRRRLVRTVPVGTFIALLGALLLIGR